MFHNDAQIPTDEDLCVCKKCKSDNESAGIVRIARNIRGSRKLH